MLMDESQSHASGCTEPQAVQGCAAQHYGLLQKCSALPTCHVLLKDLEGPKPSQIATCEAQGMNCMAQPCKQIGL